MKINYIQRKYKNKRFFENFISLQLHCKCVFFNKKQREGGVHRPRVKRHTVKLQRVKKSDKGSKWKKIFYVLFQG